MSYFISAFGGFDGENDRDAAVKFCLESLATQNALSDLFFLLPDNSGFGGLGGDPGWDLDRRDADDDKPGYEDWPPFAKFRAFVDPDEVQLGTPERFYTRAELLPFVHAIVNAYLAHNPDRVEDACALPPAGPAETRRGWTITPSVQMPWRKNEPRLRDEIFRVPTVNI